MKQKTILFITREIVPYYYGGIGTLFMSVSNLLKSFGHNVCFLTESRSDFDTKIFTKYYGDTAVSFANALSVDHFVDYSPSGGIISTFNLAYAFSIEEAFNKFLKKTRPDVVISADYGAEAFTLLLKKALGAYDGIHFICHLSGALRDILEVYQGGAKNIAFDELNEPRNRLVCSMEDTCMLLADEVVSPSSNAWKELCSRLDLCVKKGRVIPNLLSQGFREILENEEVVKSNLEEKIVLFVGRLDRLKGAEILLQVYIDYLSKFKVDTKLILIGRDCFYKEYERTFIEEWKHRIPETYESQIVFTGQLEHEQIKEYLKKASVCVFPSRWEVFGIVCLEAMAYGVPVLVSRGTGLAELLGRDLQNNVFNFDTDKLAFMERLHEILEQESYDIKFREAFRARAIEIVEQGEHGYRSLIDVSIEQSQDEVVSESVIGNMLTSLKAISDVSVFLNQDFMKLREYYGASDDDVKAIIQRGVAHPKSIAQKLRSLIK